MFRLYINTAEKQPNIENKIFKDVDAKKLWLRISDITWSLLSKSAISLKPISLKTEMDFAMSILLLRKLSAVGWKNISETNPITMAPPVLINVNTKRAIKPLGGLAEAGSFISWFSKSDKWSDLL